MKRRVGIYLTCITLISMLILPGCSKTITTEENSLQNIALATSENQPTDIPTDAGEDLTKEDIGTEKESNDEKIDFSDVQVGDVVTFGSYEQDGDTANGAEPIEWEVLSVEGNRALLVSKYVLDCKPYNTRNENVTWENCSLRAWMNGEFLNTAFTATEQARIPSVIISNPKNPYYGTEGGNDTQDKIFALSVDEIQKYYSITPADTPLMVGFYQKLMIDATPYAVNHGVNTYTMTEQDYNDIYFQVGCSADAVGKRVAWWWLRTPGFNSYKVCHVKDGGAAVGCFFSEVGSFDIGVRPALWVDL